MSKVDEGKLDRLLEKALCSTTTELHLQQYPVFHLAPKKPADTRVTYSETIKENGATLVRQWSVQVTDFYGWPGEFEAEVWRAIEHIIYHRQSEGNISNPIKTSFAEILRHMAAKGNGGAEWRRIKRALSCLGSTKIESSFFYDSNEKIRTGVEFVLIASISYSKKTLQNGIEVMDGVSIGLPKELFDNIVNRYVRPIDKGFRDGLDRWIAKRLYELLGVKFYALRKKKEPYRTRYSRLCGLLGATRQRRLSWARRVLGRAHQELEEQGFLAKVEWYPIRNEAQDWVLQYWPGPRAQAEWKKDYWRDAEIPEPLFTEKLPETESEPIWVEEFSPDETPITADVISDRPKQPLLPFVLDPPENLAVENRPAKAHPAVLDPEPASDPTPRTAKLEESEDPYATMAIKAFERATGNHRRLAQLTAAEQRRLVQWQQAGVTAADIEKGIRAALDKQAAQAKDSGKPRREIISLAYVNGYVRDACTSRQAAEREAQATELERVAMQFARMRQTPELKQAQAKIRELFLADGRRPGIKAFLLDNLILTALTSETGVFLASTQEVIEDIRSWWKSSLEKAAGRSLELLNPAEWAQRFVGQPAK